MVTRSSCGVHSAMLPHHLVVRVYDVAAPVVVSARVEAGPVRQEPLGVVDDDLGLGFEAPCDDDSLLHLDTAGVPDDW